MNMDTITASLERSLQNCSLNGHRGNHVSNRPAVPGSGGMGIGRSSSSDDVGESPLAKPDTTLELTSHISLPPHWEQCLDLKTGEIYYINWSTGMKAKEDPRSMMTEACSEGCCYYSEDDSSHGYDSEESSSESSPACSSKDQHHQLQMDKQNVLVVAGCKGCLMYFMVPKTLRDCPKCRAQLLHFDRPEN